MKSLMVAFDKNAQTLLETLILAESVDAGTELVSEGLISWKQCVRMKQPGPQDMFFLYYSVADSSDHTMCVIKYVCVCVYVYIYV